MDICESTLRTPADVGVWVLVDGVEFDSHHPPSPVYLTALIPLFPPSPPPSRFPPSIRALQQTPTPRLAQPISGRRISYSHARCHPHGPPHMYQMSTTITTVAGSWCAAHTVDIEAQTVLVHGHREHPPLPLPLTIPAYAHASTDALALQVGASDSRHDDRRAPLTPHDAPPPYTPREAHTLPSYASVAEPPTLALRLFQLGFRE